VSKTYGALDDTERATLFAARDRVRALLLTSEGVVAPQELPRYS
jgi:hypothetical protein